MKHYTLILATLLSLLLPVQGWGDEEKFEVGGMAIPPFFFDCLLTKAICPEKSEDYIGGSYRSKLNFTGKGLSKLQDQFYQNEDGNFFKQEIKGSWQMSVDPSKTSTEVIRIVGYEVIMKLDDFYGVLNSDLNTKIKPSEDGVYSYWVIELTYYNPHKTYNDGQVIMIIQLFEADKKAKEESIITLLQKGEISPSKMPYNSYDYIDMNADGFKEIVVEANTGGTMGSSSTYKHIYFFGKNKFESIIYNSFHASHMNGQGQGESTKYNFAPGGLPSNKNFVVETMNWKTWSPRYEAGENGYTDEDRAQLKEIAQTYSNNTPGEQVCTPDVDGDNWSSITCRTTIVQDGESYKP